MSVIRRGALTDWGRWAELLEDKGFPKRFPSCRGLFSRSRGQGAQILVHCLSWQLEIPWGVVTVRAQLYYPWPSGSLPSVSLLKLAFPFSLITLLSIQHGSYSPRGETGTVYATAQELWQWQPDICLATSVDWAPWWGFFLTLTTITLGGGLTILFLDTRKPRLPWEAETQPSTSQNAKPRGEGGWIWTQFCLHSGTHL